MGRIVSVKWKRDSNKGRPSMGGISLLNKNPLFTHTRSVNYELEVWKIRDF